MALRSQQIADIIDHIGRGGMKGRAAALKRQGRIPMTSDLGDPNVAAGRGDASTAATTAQRRFLDDVLLVEPEPQEKYLHPRDGLAARPMSPSGVPGHQNAAGGTLTDSDRAWLSRIDPDPALVPYDDARAVLQLQKNVTDPSDKRLVNSIAGPIQLFHDANAAHVELRNALRPLVYVPASAALAMADAVAAEVPALSPDEALARADKALQALGAARVQAHADRIEAARQRLAELTDMAELKASPVRHGETTVK